MAFATPAPRSLSPRRRRLWKQLESNYNASRLFWSFISKGIELALTMHLLSQRYNNIIEKDNFWQGWLYVSRQHRFSRIPFLRHHVTTLCARKAEAFTLLNSFSVTNRCWDASFLLAPFSCPTHAHNTPTTSCVPQPFPGYSVCRHTLLNIAPQTTVSASAPHSCSWLWVVLLIVSVVCFLKLFVSIAKCISKAFRNIKGFEDSEHH